MSRPRGRTRPRGRRSVLSVYSTDELRAAVLAMKAADRSLRSDLNKRARDTLGPEWTKGLAERAGAFTDRTILAGARVAGGNPPVLVAGNSRRRIGRDLQPVRDWAAFEYGSTQRGEKTTYERTSPRGRRHTVTRRTKAQLPRRSKTGRIIGPTVADLVPRLASLWVQTVIRTYLDAAEGKTS